jgi:hypothetical protein
VKTVRHLALGVQRAKVVEIKRPDDMLVLVAEHGQCYLQLTLPHLSSKRTRKSSLSSLQAAVGF